jgi:hypothetical protein
MRKIYYNQPYYTHNKVVEDWLCENIGPGKSRYAGHGWVMVNNFNTYARRQTSFLLVFEDWVPDEQILAFRLTWPYNSHM